MIERSQSIGGVQKWRGQSSEDKEPHRIISQTDVSGGTEHFQLLKISSLAQHVLRKHVSLPSPVDSYWLRIWVSMCDSSGGTAWLQNTLPKSLYIYIYKDFGKVFCSHAVPPEESHMLTQILNQYESTGEGSETCFLSTCWARDDILSSWKCSVPPLTSVWLMILWGSLSSLLCPLHFCTPPIDCDRSITPRISTHFIFRLEAYINNMRWMGSSSDITRYMSGSRQCEFSRYGIDYKWLLD